MLSLAIDTGRRSASHRFASALNRFSLSGLRRGLVAVLLGLPLLAGLASEAAAQTTPMANADGSYTVPQNWALKPSAVNAGGRFRLMFRTTTVRNSVSANIADYNTFVQNRAAAGQMAIRPYSSAFRVLGSTATVNARDNAMTTGTGVPIYWLGGARVADNYSDFHDGSWDSAAVRNESAGTVDSSFQAWTGSNDDGTAFTGQELGSGGQVRTGTGNDGLSGRSFTGNASLTTAFFALSPVFLVGSHEASISLTSTTGSEGNSGSQDTRFQINMAPARSSNTFFLVCIDPGSTATYLREGRDFILRTGSRNSFIVGVGSTTQTEGTTTPGCTTVVVGANATSTGTTYNIRTDGDTTDEPDETVVLTLARLTTSSSSVNTPNGVGITTGRVTYTITDDDPTIVSLARVGTGAVSEVGTIGLTVSLSRPLIAGEIIDVPLAIGGTGVTTDDWSLAPFPGDGFNTGVTLSAQTTAMPQLRFSGVGAQTAILVLSPTFDDTAEGGGTETYTIALGPNDNSANGFDHASRGTNVGGGADPHASANTIDVMVTDAVTHTVSISLDRTMAAEGDSGITDGATVTVTFDPPYTGNLNIHICFGGTATRGDSADWRFTRPNNSAAIVNSGCHLVADFVTNFASLQRKIRINGDTVDELDETVTLTLQRVNATPREIVFDSDADSVTFTITDDDTAGVTITETNDATTLAEDGGTDDYGMMLTSQPTANVTIMATSGTTATATINPSSLIFTSANWNTAQSITVTGVDNAVDAANQEVTISHAITSTDSTYSAITPDPVTATVIDDEPTVVSLTRFGGATGAINEGAEVTLVVDLSRQLIDGETIDVPLSISGTNVTPADWNLALSDISRGATLSGEDTSTPLLRISDAASFGGANLILTPTFDETDEGGTETYTIALGPDGAGTNGFDRTTLGTNVGGGADPHATTNTLDLEVLDSVRHTMSLSLDSEMGAEGDSGLTDGATMTVTMDPPNPQVVSFSIQLGGTATRGGNDYSVFVAGSNTDGSASDPTLILNFPANRATLPFRIRANGDTVDESDETVTLALVRFGTFVNVIFEEDATTVTYTITDDDTAGVTITETNDATTLAEGGTDDYGMMLTSQPTADVTITPTSGTPATATINPNNLVFTSANWAMAQTFTVTGENNNADAANQEVTISHAITSTDTNYSGLTSDPITATVTDDDATTVTLAGAAGNVMEGAAKEITVTLGRALAEGEALAVPLTFMGEATPGTDYTVTGAAASGVAYTGLDSATGTVTFTGPSATIATLTLSATPDSDVEASGETVIIGLGTLDGDSGTGLGGGASGTDSLDDFSIEDPLLISITGGTAVTEGSPATFTVTANRVPSSALMIDLTVADAAAGDYLDSGDEGDNMVTLSGATTATVEIPTQTDSTDETNGTITVTIADGTGYTVGMPSSAMVGVTDDDATTVTLTGTAGNISEGVTRNLTVTLDRALVAGESLAVPLTLGGTATRGTDYTLTGTAASGLAYNIPDTGNVGTVTFTGPALATATLALAVQVDGTSDASETITIALGTLDSNSGTGLGGGASGTGSLDFTIMEDPTIVLPLTLTVAEGDTDGVGYPVSLATAPMANVTVTVTGHSGTDLTLNPNSLEFTATNWNMIQTFTVTAATDADAANDTVSLTHTASGSAADYDGSITGAVTVTITDPDTADVTISETAITIAEGGEGTYTVVLATQPASGVEITMTSDTTSAATVSPLILTFTTANWDMEQTATVTGVNDNRVNAGGERTAMLSHRISSGDGGTYPTDGPPTPAAVMVTVSDNDEAGLSFSGEMITVAEGATANYTVALTTIPTGDVTVTVSGHSGTDLTPDETSLTFTMTDWDTAQTVTVTAVQDGDAADDTVSLTHTASGTTGYGAVTGAVTVIITDDDTAAITISETAGTTTVLENGSEAGGTDTYTVVLATQPASGVEITVTSDLTSAATVSPPILTFTMTNWDMEQTVTVTGVDDNINNPGDARMATLSHRISSGDSGDYPTGGPPTPAAVTVTVTDDDVAPGVTLSETEITVAEANGMDTYTMVLNTPPSGEVEITVTSGLTSAATATPTSLTFTTVNWDTAQTVTVTGINDDDTGDRESTIGHAITTGDGGSYAVGDLNQDVTVTVTDDDAVAGVTLSTARITVAEANGMDTYTVVLDTPPAGDVEITVASDTPGAATVAPLSLEFTASNWDTVQTVTVTGVNDNVGGNRTATISHSIDSGDGDGAGYPDGLAIATVEVTVTDDDEPVASFAVAGFTTNEGSGTYNVVVNLTPVPAANTTISYTVAGTSTAADYAALTGTVVASASASSVNISVVITDDSTQEGSETVILTLTAGSGYTVGTDRVHTLTIADNDAAPVGTGAMQEMQAAQEAWLPRFGLTAVEHLLGGLDYRLSVADQPGLSGNVSGLSAGRALHGGGNGTGTGYGLGADGFGQGGGGGDGLGAGSVDRLLNLSRTLSLRDMLRGSRFVHRGGENGVSVWGQASYSRYEDDQDGIAVDGEVTTGMLGVDRDNGRTLLGLALSYSDGDGDWSGASEQGELSSQLTSLLPYIRHNVTQRLQVWAAASYGRGELEQTLEQTSATMSTEHDIEQRSASAGVRGILLERPLEEGGLTLTLISDAALARIESDDADGMSGMSADTQRFRMGLEWSWQLPQADGGRLIPELELGMRYDGGDTSDGLGVELGGGISWQLPSRGLTIDLRGRRLLDHEAADRREWGVSGSLRYERQPGSAHGPSLSLRQEYGTAPASGGLDRLLSDSLSDALEEDSSQPGPASGRWSLEGEWGLALNDGATGIPYAGLSSSDAGHDLTLGWRLLSAPGDLDTELDVKALRRRDDEGKTNHGIGAQWKLRW